MSEERQPLNEKTPWWGEHLHRYQVALGKISQKDMVLDIATGSGFGAELLSRKANKVIGADISENDIHTNRKLWGESEKLCFHVMDGTRLDYPDNTFDKIVSFETIEHTAEYEKMLNELHRCLKKGGLLFLSTPNIIISSPKGIIDNPFHIQEFNFDDFERLLSTRFSNFEIFGQAYIRYNNKNTINYKIARIIEKFFYLKVVRKTPIKIQDWIMNLLIKQPQYPIAENFSLSRDKDFISKKCATLFAICTK